ncbi:NAD(P)/FAD-dependent oxidoreductase [Heliophilum fasciatum]|uniref:Thioredoxin reductase (NADPH) n=1 Tax=Heliophilum fasciatum TaxID=35700 RepID=A0A4R2RW72_9FIRM|nr:FAD-dependent oxidoreductase [Heliophilum fasciatum]MCW2277393.1 thioredoxin reductase (NADPH) [Heliophilum fasciatum]TCP67229.1 thioredoxin reductase (NADPH) [Heliophilum fasciatum]
MATSIACAVIGCGPAGASAALNLKIRNIPFVLFDPGQSYRWRTAERIDNYLGLPACSGEDFLRAIKAHLDQMSIAIMPSRISAIQYDDDHFFQVIAGQETWQCKSMILATGVTMAKELPGESDLLGRGVSYCATCDGPLYRHKVVAVIDTTGGDGMEEVYYLSGIAQTVYYLPVKSIPSPATLTALTARAANIKVLQGVPKAIHGDEVVRSLELDNTTQALDGVFILRPTQRAEQLLPGLATTEGAITVDALMRTNLPGVFAAGDCTGKPYQFARAVGQGAIAGLSVASYLSN